MPYGTSIERNAKHEGIRQTIISALLIRFERVPEGVKELLDAVGEDDALMQIHANALRAASVEEFQQSLPTLPTCGD